MKKVTVISGKGGTGKTTVTANLAQLAGNLMLADCDVDAPNLKLLLKAVTKDQDNFQGAQLAVKDESRCIECGLCYQVCRFEAVAADFSINRFKCEGCKLCVEKCPTGALQLVKQITGDIFQAETEFGPLVHASLRVGSDNSGKLVSEVRSQAAKLAAESQKELLLIDGSPGIGCPVIASLTGVDAALIVTEATQSGLADLKRLLQVITHFKLTALIVINKFDLNEELTAAIIDFCQQQGHQVIGKIPFDSTVVAALHDQQLLSDYQPESKAFLALEEIWQQLKATLELS